MKITHETAVVRKILKSTFEVNNKQFFMIFVSSLSKRQ